MDKRDKTASNNEEKDRKKVLINWKIEKWEPERW